MKPRLDRSLTREEAHVDVRCLRDTHVAMCASHQERTWTFVAGLPRRVIEGVNPGSHVQPLRVRASREAITQTHIMWRRESPQRSAVSRPRG